MKSLRPPGRPTRGFALLTVLMFIGVMVILTGSMLRYSINERRLNERNRLVLRARNMAENISVFAAEQLTTKLYRLRSSSPMAFMTGTNQIYLPPDQVLTSEFTNPAGMEVRAGLTSSTGLAYIDPTNPANAGNPNAGLSASTSQVPIISKATASHPALGTVTAYCQHDLEVAMIPLFQFAIFYNMDLEFSPGANMVVTGPVHANGSLIARCQTAFSNTVEFTERVTAVRGFFANTGHKGTTYMDTGAADAGPGGTGPLYFRNPAGTVTNIQNASGVWRDHKFGTSTETATTLNQFKTFATSTYSGNLRTSVHGVTSLVLPAISSYREVDDPTTPSEDERNNGRQIIEPSRSTDFDRGLIDTKIARRAGLYIIVNPDNVARVGTLPDASSVTMRARSYRCWLNVVDTATAVHSLREVVLPGQPSYGTDNATVNALPNRYLTTSSIGHNQVLRIPQGGGVDVAGSGYGVGAGTPTMGAFADAFFFDLRRATNNRGFPFSRGAGASSYKPRPIAKIDFDMTRFRMMVERTISGATTTRIYDPGTPNAANWAASIFNPAGSPATYGLGTVGGAFTTFPVDGFGNITVDPYKMYYATAPAVTPVAVSVGNLVSTVANSPWYDGITVYIHSVDAEVRRDSDSDGYPDRIDSGVRLWNGRGPIATLNPTTYSGRTGFSLATNDPVYVIGHFNADGVVNSTATATGYGGYSARYPDSASEMLTSVMGDAITILSQPVFSGVTFQQTSGWSDSLSAHRRQDGVSFAWSAAWATTDPSTSNRQDGVDTSFVPAAMPNLGNLVPGAGAARTYKFAAAVTEVSSCFLIGIVPTNHNPTGLTDGPPSPAGNNQTSGGVHNYPRLCEAWSGTGLYIRGSMVAMFESRVAMEPWSIRLYSGAGRFWGLHQSLRDANHDLPLEPMLLNARRARYKEINAAEYAIQKAIIEALPH